MNSDWERPGPLGHGPHHDEERDHAQRVVGEEEEGRGLEVGEEGVPAVQEHIAAGPAGEHGEPDRHAERYQHEQDAEGERADRRLAQAADPRQARAAVTIATTASHAANNAESAMAQPIGRPNTMVVVPLASVSRAPTAVCQAIKPATAP